MKTILCLLLCLLPGSALSGQEASSPREAPLASVSGAFFALYVPNLDASVEWYTAKLGLAVSMRLPKKDGVAVVVLEGPGLIVELIESDQASPSRSAKSAAGDLRPARGFFKAGVTVDRFDELLAELRKRGVEFFIGPFPARDGQRANVVIKDNAGNLIQFFGNRPE